MKNYLFILVLVVDISFASILYQEGYSTYWVTDHIPYLNTYSQTIPFPVQFERIPQVAFAPLKLLYTKNTVNGVLETGYRLSITSITVSECVLTLYLDIADQWGLTLRWIAIDDQRIEILSNYNVANPTSTTLPHQNPNALSGIILLASFRGRGTFDFSLSLGLINSTSVEVDIATTNVSQLGYFIILGPSEFLDIETEINLKPKEDTNTASYYSRDQPNLSNSVWFFYFKSFGYKVNYNFYIQMIPTFGETSSSYHYSSLLGGSGYFTKVIHQCATLNFQPIPQLPLLMRKVSLSSSINPFQQRIIQLKIPQLNKIYSTQVISDFILLNSNQSELTFNLFIPCSQNQRVKQQYYNCQDCEVTSKEKINSCLNDDFAINIQATYNQPQQFKKYIYITINSNQVQIKQILQNQVLQQIIIAQFDII